MIQKQLLKYVIVGIVSSICHFFIASLYIMFIDRALFVSNLIGFMTAFVWSCFAQSKFVFKTTLSVKKVTRYFIVQFASLVLSVNLANMSELKNIYLKILLIVIILPVCTFVIHKFWTFVDNEQ